MLIFILSSITFDTFSIIAICAVTLLYLLYATHALVNTIKYIRKVPGLTLNKEVLTLYGTFTKKEVPVTDIKHIELLEHRSRYIRGIKYIKVIYQTPNRNKVLQINDLYKTSIMPLYKILKELIK